MGGFLPAFFDPLHTKDLTAIICRQFEEQPAHKLAGLPRFEGSGLYAIYYAGTKESLYLPLKGRLIPLYAGSGQSHNSATGTSSPTASPLRTRLDDHERSIAGSGLDESEFEVRLLRMPDVHIDLGENGLRVGYQPVWNSVLTGFGSHEQGSSTRTGEQSKWDAVHSGRSRSHGKKRTPKDVATLKLEVAYAVKSQVAVCGANLGLDWSNFDPGANRRLVMSRPTTSTVKSLCVDYVVKVHGVDRQKAEAMTKQELSAYYR